jgi:hypothetical protein
MLLTILAPISGSIASDDEGHTSSPRSLHTLIAQSKTIDKQALLAMHTLTVLSAVFSRATNNDEQLHTRTDGLMHALPVVPRYLHGMTCIGLACISTLQFCCEVIHGCDGM